MTRSSRSLRARLSPPTNRGRFHERDGWKGQRRECTASSKCAEVYISWIIEKISLFMSHEEDLSSSRYCGKATQNKKQTTAFAVEARLSKVGRLHHAR